MIGDESFELYVLMECAEDAFGLGRMEDFKWQAARPGSSPTNAVILALIDRGHLEVVERIESGTGRRNANAVITPEGRRRMGQLIAAGVEPDEGCD